MDMSWAFHYLEAEDRIVFPHGFVPGSCVGGCSSEFTSATWAAYDWDTVGGVFPDITAADPAASPKPSWSQLLAARKAAEVKQLRAQHSKALKAECERRIMAAYGETTLNDEILLRLRNGHTAAQDVERDRLRARYRRLKLAMMRMTSVPLRAFKPELDSHWEA